MRAIIAIVAASLLFSPAALAASKKVIQACDSTDADTAIEACTKIVNSSREAKKLKAAAYSQIAFAYAKKNQYDLAFANITLALALNPTDPDSLLRKALFSLWTNKRDVAVAELTSLIAANPRYANSYYWRGLAYSDMGRHADAVADLTIGITLQPTNVEFYRVRASVRLHARDFDGAIADATQVIASDPTLADGYLYRAQGYKAKGNWDATIADAGQAIALNPQSADAYFERGYAYVEKNQPELALPDYTRAIEIFPQSVGSLANRAQIYIRQGKVDLGLADLSRVVEILPQDADARARRAAAYANKGDEAAALADWQASEQLNPRNASLYMDRGFYLQGKNRLEESLADYSKANELQPGNPDVLNGIADVQMRMGRLADARKSAEQALAINPKHEYATATLREIGEAEKRLAARDEVRQQDDTTAPPAAISADPGHRVALVIGNSAYQHTPALANPRNDATDIAAALTRLGFEVILLTDLGKRDMDVAFGSFARKLTGADAALFYYAGHAMQFEGVNYLMPVDARLEDEAYLPYEMAKLDDVLADLNRVHGVRIAVLDSCRDNPLEAQLKKASSRSAGATRGLSRVPKADGLLVAFSTQSGSVAADGDARNSPYTAALLKFIETPGLEVGLLFRRVTGSVKIATDGKQIPELSISLDKEFYLKPQATAGSN